MLGNVNIDHRIALPDSPSNIVLDDISLSFVSTFTNTGNSKHTSQQLCISSLLVTG